MRKKDCVELADIMVAFLLCGQETRRKENKAINRHIFKLFYNDVEIILNEQCVRRVMEGKRVRHRIRSSKLEIEGVSLNVASVCATQVGCQKNSNSGVSWMK